MYKYVHTCTSIYSVLLLIKKIQYYVQVCLYKCANTYKVMHVFKAQSGRLICGITFISLGSGRKMERFVGKLGLFSLLIACFCAFLFFGGKLLLDDTICPALKIIFILSEVITSAEFHPTHCNTLAYSSSKGSIRLIDLRQSALCDSHAKL